MCLGEELQTLALPLSSLVEATSVLSSPTSVHGALLNCATTSTSRFPTVTSLSFASPMVPIPITPSVESVSSPFHGTASMRRDIDDGEMSGALDGVVIDGIVRGMVNVVASSTS